MSQKDRIVPEPNEMKRRTRDFDWAATPLGPRAQWPQGLKTAVEIMLGSRYAMWLGWGPELTYFYNDAYAEMTLGAKHPWALGRPAKDVWSETWSDLGPRAESVLQTGEATWDESLLLFLQRRNFLEETYHTFSYSALSADDGSIGGLLCVVTEDTERVIGERRLNTLRELAARTSESVRTVTQACQDVARVLQNSRKDLPVALVYLLENDGQHATLEGVTGIDPTLPICVDRVDISERGVHWPFQEVVQRGRSVEVGNLGHHFGEAPAGIWPEVPQKAVVLPLSKPGQNQLAGFLVAMVSPRLEFDDAYRGFFELVAGQIATAVANARAYEEERKRAEALAELDRAKTTFFSNVSHEFRTPLTLMLGPIEEMLNGVGEPLPGSVKANLEVVNRNALRLLRLVNSLLDFSRVEAGRNNALFQPTDIAGFTIDLASVFRSALERGGLKLIINCPPMSEPVYLDREMWEKIVLNLLSNAFKFTFEGSVSVSLQAWEEGVELCVQDSGTGIAEDQLPHLFDRFHRIENVRSRTHEGSGIGLALVQELVKLHGGTIKVESQIDIGTLFSIHIPFGKHHLPAEQVAEFVPAPFAEGSASRYLEEALRWLPDEALEIDTIEGQPPLILVADDNADMREYIVRLLSENYRVVAVADGEAALEVIRRRRPNLVLSDVMMPKLDGFGLLRLLRDDPDLQQIPVIMLSARAGAESRIDGMEAGADDYLVKPFSARELLVRVDSYLKISKLRTEAARQVRENQLKLRLALEVARMVHWEWDQATDKLELSQNAQTVFGVLPDSSIQNLQSAFDLVHPDDRAFVRTAIENAADSASEFHFEFRILRPDNGDTAWFEQWGYAIVDESRNSVRLDGVAMDVTERKVSETALHKSESHLRAVIENTPECIKIVDKQGTLLQMNDAGQQMIEVSKGARVIGGCVYDLIAPEYRDAFKAFNERICAGERGELEFDIIGYQGTRRHMESHAVALKRSNGDFVQLALTRDISARRRAEIALRNERDLLAITLRSIGDAVIATDSNACITNMNAVAEALTGWTLNEAMGQPLESVFRIVNETSRDNVENPALKALRDGVVVGLANHTLLIHKQGHEFPIDDSAAPIISHDGKLVGCVLVFRDISERKIMENALRESEAHFRHMADNAPTMLWVSDPEGACTFLSRGWYEYTGQTEAEGVGLGWLAAVHPEDRDRIGTIFSDANRAQREFSFDYRLKGHNGEYRWAIDAGRPRFDARGHYLGYVGAVFDVHERKLAEYFRSSQALILEMITTEQKLSEILPELVNLIEKQIVGAIGSILLLNASGTQLATGSAPRLPDFYNRAIDGIEIGPAAGSCGTAIYTHQRVIVDDIGSSPLWEDFRGLAHDSGLHACWSEPITAADGTLLGTFAVYFQQVRSPKTAEISTLESVARFAGIAIDRPRAQQALREREQRFRVFTQATSDMVFRVSANWYEVHQIEGRAFIRDANRPSDKWIENYIYQDDLATALAELEIAAVNKQVLEFEHRVVRQDGSLGWTLTRAIPILSDSGDIIEWFGAATDITERKSAQEAQIRNAETFATLVEQSPLGIYVVDSDFRIALVSLGSMPAFQNVQPVIGRDFAEVMRTIWPPSFAEDAIRIFRHTLNTGEPYLAPSLTEQRKDLGEQESYEWQVNRIVLADGQFGVVCYYYDSTRLQAALQALGESEERFRMLAENMSQLAWTCEVLGKVTWLNQRWLDYIGRPFEEMGDEGWLQTIHPDYISQVKGSIANALRSGEVWEDTFPLLGYDGQYRWFLSRAIPIRDEREVIVYWFGTNTDITELRETQQLLQEADERKNEFLATLAHELRNPLAPIRTGLDFLRMTKANPVNVDETLSTMERQTLQLITLVDDLLDVSRITRGKLELKRASVALSDIVKSAVEASNPFIVDSGHRLTVRLPENPVYLHADPHRMAQVISNVLNNAAKYTPDGGEIQLMVIPNGEWVSISVKDNGIGIPPAMLGRIFEMFTQIEHPIERTYAGLGIGLTLVKRLVEMHGGSISVQSEGELKGSTFVVRLPILKETDTVSERMPAEQATLDMTAELRIVIADDNKDAASTLTQLIEILGHEVFVAHDGWDAIQLAEKVRPDVILMDIGMPNMNGYEATREIRLRPWGSEITIIALTGWGQSEDRRKTAEAGFNHHLVKPLDLSELTSLLSGLSGSVRESTSTDEISD
ncbi:PAS domain S-box protein [Ketobacter sp. MCCC 1A13808]|uniref:PAS domain S-box protein n=1 Tax=Ketobacter sp. MCCC 1A13808 TaxID=2602738 RepID=UPI0012EB1DDD|nr:PAS domain S-box protein [Ketobacter sp. MCCC 1A13808]MVF14475.1 PAS domain S-box protein [Ketobacter sp. MCCC 1A13808]